MWATRTVSWRNAVLGSAWRRHGAQPVGYVSGTVQVAQCGEKTPRTFTRITKEKRGVRGRTGAQAELPGMPCNPIANRNGSGGCRFEPIQDDDGLFGWASAPEVARCGYSAAAAALGRTRASSTPPAIATATNETATPPQPAACWMAPDTGAESSVPRLRPMFSTPSATPA